MSFYFRTCGVALRRCRWGAILFSALWLAVLVEELSAQTHVLTVEVGPFPDGTVQQHAFTTEDLVEMSGTEYTTSTVWTEGVDRFSGVLLWEMLLHLGIDPATWRGEIRLQAIDGYRATLGPAQVHQDAPMLAVHQNGRLMPLRARGPVWLIYPYDDNPTFRNETIYALSVWQIEYVSITP